ncbi:MAG: HAMP domain-containing histidine kinase [Polyangiaceae bacterium]|nr:HAMP domain-containing histidine kinase [Polyangiaceae bacterium]
MKPVSAGLSILYAIFVLAHLWMLPRAIAVPLSLVAAAMAVLFLSLYALLRRRAVPGRWAHPIGVGMVGGVLAHSSVQVVLTADLQHTTNFLLLAVGAGAFLFSVFWLVFVLTLVWVSWGGVVWMIAPPAAWGDFAWALLLACVLSAVVFVVRMRMYARVQALQSAAQDITSRKVIEQQRADFFAMLTHDIRNPLGVILGDAELLLEEMQTAAEASERRQVLQRLRANLLTVHSLLANYLDLARIEAGQLTLVRTPVALNPLLRQVAQQYEPEAQHKSLRFTMRLQEDLPLVEGDAIALERVFANLLLNAFKFSPAGGRVTVDSQAYENEVRVTVADNGPGIAPDELPLLFEKYRRAHHARLQAGTGLGLFIVKTLVEAQGGRIEVESVPGEGTRFSVSLPAASFSSSAAL